MKRRTTLIALVSSLAVLLTALLTGCAAHAFDNPSQLPQQQEVQSKVSQPAQSSPTANAKTNQPSSPYISLEKVREIALTHAGVAAADARWDDREFDFEKGRAVYELNFDANGTEYDYEVDALTGKILKAHSQRDDDRPASASKPAEATYIGLEKAKSLALEKAGLSADDVRWEKAELDRDDGRTVYELEFRTDSAEYDVDIHAESGKILDYEADRYDWDDDRDDDNDWDD